LPSRRAFVAARPDERLGEQVTAFLEGEALSGGQSEQLLALLGERLGRYEKPRELVYVPHFKTTASGKLDRRGTVKALNEG
jgi:O-succinylbenzoic acid--CoA ligase